MYVSGYPDAYNLAVSLETLQDGAERISTACSEQPAWLQHQCAEWPARAHACVCAIAAPEIVQALRADELSGRFNVDAGRTPDSIESSAQQPAGSG